MHRFNSLLLLGFALTLAAQPHAGAAAAPSPNDGAALAQKFEFQAVHPDTPDLQIAKKQLDLVRNQANAGVATNDQLLAMQGRVEDLQRHVPYVFTLQSKGGSLRELAARISMSGEFDFTIVNAGDPSDLETPLPAFALRNVSWVTIVEVLDNFLAAREVQLKLVGFENSEDPRASRSVICVLRRLGPSSAAKLPASGFDSFQLTDYLFGEQTVDTIVDAVRTAWKMDPTRSDSALQLKYHPATNLLFVSGPEPAVLIARQVIAGLRKKKPLIQ